MSLPPLASFRFFNAAAQNQSFMKAAEQLHVTHGAVSRQIRSLEDALGVELFDRRNRAVFLNHAGRLLHDVTQPMFEQLEQAVRQVQQKAREDTLVVSCEPTIAMKWLIPRLPAFHQAHPQIQIQLLAAGGPIDFLDAALTWPFDATIFAGTIQSKVLRCVLNGSVRFARPPWRNR
ncbi:Glycine cleavage system transcriptional activator [Pseudomonas sp. MM227]|nr:Glycine cleavage system transcriptional activator [Pseudomonas sp. MM227]